MLLMNSSALIGYTGFVGSNLSRQLDFDAYYNSSNIAEIRGREFDFVVIAAVQAKKWWANQHPDKDWSMIELLLTELATMVARQIVLISTVDVLPPIAGADESFDPHGHANHTYGQNRLHFEDAVRRLHETVTIIRLPGLFGPGLRKNIIYDLLNNNQVEKINPGSRVQYY
jgi:nucleoside-diphosphate-sugar epimerase